MKYGKKSSGSRLYDYMRGGGVISRGYSFAQEGGMIEGDPEKEEMKKGQFFVKDGEIYKALKGGKSAKQTPSQVYKYLDDMGLLVAPDLVGGATGAKKRSVASHGIAEALKTGDLGLLSDYIDPNNPAASSAIIGLELKQNLGGERAVVAEPAGLNRFGNR